MRLACLAILAQGDPADRPGRYRQGEGVGGDEPGHHRPGADPSAAARAVPGGDDLRGDGAQREFDEQLRDRDDDGAAPVDRRSATTTDPNVDETLQHPRTVFQILKRHYARYTPEMVQEVCGIPVASFHEVARALRARCPTRWVHPSPGQPARR